MKRIRVNTVPSGYDVLVGPGESRRLGALMRARRARDARGAAGQVVVCCDENVAPLYLEAADDSLRAAGFGVSHIVLPVGEREKNLRRAEELYGVLYDRGIRRGDTLVALGGGVIGDLTGFVAATYQRGVGLVQVPTTLLAQVDASVGGKVAVDFRAGKNYVGTFYQPQLVVADLETLKTLPLRELRCGAAEVAKHGLLAGGPVLARIERFARRTLDAAAITQALVADSVAFKAAVVVADEREAGRRAILNLGHTVGHAIEAATGFSTFSHGEAVGLGLRATLRLSRTLCGLSAEDEAHGQALLDGLGLPSRLVDTKPEEVCALIGRDKKAGPAGVGYVLLRHLGEPVLGVTVPPRQEAEVVAWLTRR